MTFRRLSALAIVPSLLLAACGRSEDRPPPLPPADRNDHAKVNCACTVPWSPAAQQYLQLSQPTSSIVIDACYPTANDFSGASDFCTSTIPEYVSSMLEDVLLWRTEPIARRSDICEGSPPPFGLFVGDVTCALVPFENDGADSSEFIATGVKLEPFCTNALSRGPEVCQFDSSVPGQNCELSLDPASPFDPSVCSCNTALGCDEEPVTLARPPVGNADDPLPLVLFEGQGPIADLTFGRKDGIVNDGTLSVSVTAEGCVDLPSPIPDICASDSDSDSANLFGGFRVYGGPCPGSSCAVALEANVRANDLDFEFGFDTPVGFVTFAEHTISDFILFGGSGEFSLMVDAAGNGTIPAGSFQYRSFWRDNGSEKQSIDFFDDPVPFHIDWATRTLRVQNADVDFGNAQGTFSFTGTFEPSFAETSASLCPKPVLETPSQGLATSCTTDSALRFDVPDLVLGCRDTPAVVVGSIFEVNGQTLATPIPVVGGTASAPRGRLGVRWTAFDTLGRSDTVEQVVDAVSRPAVMATNSLDLGDRFVAREVSGALGAVANSGTTTSVLGNDGAVGEFGSMGRVTLRDRASIQSLLVSPLAPIRFNQTTLGAQAFVVPGAVPFPALPAAQSSSTDVFVPPDGVQALAPGVYRDVVVHPRARLQLTAGDYVIGFFDLESESHLVLDKAQGPIRVLVTSSAILRGTYDHSPPAPTNFVLGYSGQQTLFLETPFRGTVVAPNGAINLRALNQNSHHGEFFARDVKTEGGATVLHVPAACE